MNFDEKKEFLEHAKDLAMNLEDKTNEFIEVQIGWIGDFGHLSTDMPVTIMLNHEKRWFGSFEKLGWNENVIWNNINNFVPIINDYLALNELIEKAYKG